ncbi:hypothetical protein KY329_00450 [Candidatus Woesearchaeota archaeon]|nr:hypothetical protein [Candidatus Woesearchaeota archaeon]
MNKPNIVFTALPVIPTALLTLSTLENKADAQSVRRYLENLGENEEVPPQATDPEYKEDSEKKNEEPQGLGTDFSLMLSGNSRMTRADARTSFDIGWITDDITFRGRLGAGIAEFDPYMISVNLPFGTLTDSTFEKSEGYYGQGLLGIGFSDAAEILAGYTQMELGESVHGTHGTPVFTAAGRFDIPFKSIGLEALSLGLDASYSYGEAGIYQSATGDMRLSLAFDENWSAFLAGTATWGKLKRDNEQFDARALIGASLTDGKYIRGNLGIDMRYGWAKVLDEIGSVLDGSGRFGTIPGQEMRVPWQLGLEGEIVLTPFKDKNWELVLNAGLPVAGFGPGADRDFDFEPAFGYTLGIRYNFGGSDRNQNPFLLRTTGASSTYGRSVHRDGAQ